MVITIITGAATIFFEDGFYTKHQAMSLVTMPWHYWPDQEMLAMMAGQVAEKNGS